MKRGIWLLAALLVVPVFSVFAGDMENEEGDVFNNNLDYQISYIPSSKLDDGSGKVEIIRHKTEYAHGRRLYDKIPVKFTVRAERINISQNTEVEIPRSLRSVETELEFTLPALTLEDTYFRMQLCPSFYGDTWSFESSAFRMPVNMFLIHKVNERLYMIGGLGVASEYETPVYPIFGLIYKPNDVLSFNLIPPRPSIEYKASEKVTLFAAGQFDFNSEYEVKSRDKQQAPILQFKEMDLMGGMKYALNKNIRLSAAVGGAMGRVIKYRDGGGKLNINSALYSELMLETRF